MPDEATWNTFFDPAATLRTLGLNERARLVVEFGCGYGTFTTAAAQLGPSVVALDIDPEMVARTQAKATALGLENVRCEVRDFVEHGTGLADGAADFVMLFNILHAVEEPAMLAEARRVLVDGGTLGVMHWNYDPSTPRGPSMSIRPRPEQLRELVIAAGFEPASSAIDLPPYHYGLVFRKPISNEISIRPYAPTG